MRAKTLLKCVFVHNKDCVRAGVVDDSPLTDCQAGEIADCTYVAVLIQNAEVIFEEVKCISI